MGRNRTAFSLVARTLVAVLAVAVMVGLVSPPGRALPVRAEVHVVQLDTVTLTAADASASDVVSDIGAQIGYAIRTAVLIVVSPVLVPAFLVAALLSLACIDGGGCDNGGPIDTFRNAVFGVWKFLRQPPTAASARAAAPVSAKSASPVQQRRSTAGAARHPATAPQRVDRPGAKQPKPTKSTTRDSHGGSARTAR